MKKTKPSGLIAVIFLAASFSVLAQDPFTNGLVAYYPFNGNANDASGNGNNGTVTAATLAPDRFGNPNSAYAFDGVSSLITVADSPSLRIASNITVTCWLSFAQSNLLNVRFVGKGGDFYRNYVLSYDSGTSWLFQQFPPSGGGGCQENTASSIPTVVVGKWYQLVGVRSGGSARLYVNGAQTQERSVCEATTYTGSEPFVIGAPQPANDGLMNGKLDDIRIYNRALSSAEVAQLYAIESGLRVDLIKAVKPVFSNLTLGTNYQLQVSGDLNNWTNQGSVFTATNANMTYPQYFDVDNWAKLFFRLLTAP